jgi:hypothetical protein
MDNFSRVYFTVLALLVLSVAGVFGVFLRGWEGAHITVISWAIGSYIGYAIAEVWKKGKSK